VASRCWFGNDLKQAARTLTKESLPARRADLWRYQEVLPVDHEQNIVSLGEGWTPLLHAERLGELLEMRETVHQGRVAKSNTEFQGARHDGGGFDGQRTGRQKNSRCRRRETQPERSPPTPRGLEWKPSSSCRATRHGRTWLSASKRARTSR